ncbi:hypothetical protein D9757_013239 [Collybiopsis confluens]|uniref:SET domain-containing protein n=1 Tax=Collybiopsis confluens TaxID=2823264 RepID=A0A8H5D0T5_9AGAR|nr:hypothetical protein D9757_013239 [Collybiopsis confluens]
MKRGFLNTPRAKKQIEKSNGLETNLPKKADSIHESSPAIKVDFSYKYSYGELSETGVPKGYKNSKLENTNFPDEKKAYDPKIYIHTRLPPRQASQGLSNSGGCQTECLVSGFVKRTIHETPGFPSDPLPCPGGICYRIGDAGEKGLGVFSTRLIGAGELIIDERPLIILPSSSIFAYIDDPNFPSYTHEQQKQIQLHEQNRAMQVVYDRMLPENQKAFMELYNCHKSDGSGEFMGRVRTNGLMVDPEQFRDADTTGDFGIYSAIYKVLSRINHSCCPNTIRKWHTDTFTHRLYAARDIPPNTEITLQYCNLLDSSAERAQALAPYGISACTCSPACNGDPAQIKLSSERRARTKRALSSILFPPKHFTPGVSRDRWLLPAIERLRDLEEEQLEGLRHYKGVLFTLTEAYIHLCDVEKALMYGRKLKKVYKAWMGEELDPMYWTEKGIRASPMYRTGMLIAAGEGYMRIT